MIQARTAYSVPIPKAFPNAHEAVAWAEDAGKHTFGDGLHIVRLDAKGRARRVWPERAK